MKTTMARRRRRSRTRSRSLALALATYKANKTLGDEGIVSALQVQQVQAQSGPAG